LRLILLYLIHL